ASVQSGPGSRARRSPTRVGTWSAAIRTLARTGRSRTAVKPRPRLPFGHARSRCRRPQADPRGDQAGPRRFRRLRGRRRVLVRLAGLPMVSRTNPDLVLLDLRMPGADGLTCLSQIRKRHPDVKVVVLSVSTDENLIQTILKRGASAYIVKSINPIDLPSALRQAVEGTVFSAIGLPEASDSPARAVGLTDRE